MLSECRDGGGSDRSSGTALSTGLTLTHSCRGTQLLSAGFSQGGTGAGNGRAEPLGPGEGIIAHPYPMLTTGGHPPAPCHRHPVCAGPVALPFLQPPLVSCDQRCRRPARVAGGWGGPQVQAGYSPSSHDWLPHSVFFISLDFSRCSKEKLEHLVFNYYVLKNAILIFLLDSEKQSSASM